jgi:hypothetical protein
MTAKSFYVVISDEWAGAGAGAVAMMAVVA